MVERRPALGKGLSALIPDAPERPSTGPLEIDIDLIVPNEEQPRVQMDASKLEDLARSIKTNGVIQPILVRKVGATYQIIAGERRWRAAQQAGLLKVPVVVRDVPAQSRQQLLELALIENVQRENLNPIDEALAYQRLSEEFGLTQDQIAAAVGKDRTSVANYVRLLRLPDDVRRELAAGSLSMGHARALLAISDAQVLREAVKTLLARGLSVRATEELARRLTDATPRQGPPREREGRPDSDVHTRAAEDRMRFALGTKVRIVRRGAGGTVEIEFGSEAELNRVFEIITTRA